MNYYAEWWENARKQTGILTKPTYLKQLEKELAQLKANPDYQHLATELAQWKTKYEKVKETERNLLATEQNLTKLNIEAENTQKDKEKELKELASRYSEIKGLIEKRLAEQKQEYESKLKTATNNQASILKTNLFQATENKELNREISELKEQLSLLSSSETDQQRELQERGKLIIKLEEQQRETKKELEFSESQLAFANSKVKQLSPLFNQVLGVIKKNVIIRGKKELKEAIANIQELMEWEKSPLVTETNTPTEPIKTAEQLATEEELVAVKKTIMDKKDLETKNTDLEAKIKELEETIKDLKKVKEPVKTETKLIEESQASKTITLQQYLDKKYPTKEEKEKVKSIGFDRVDFLNNPHYHELLSMGIFQLAGGEVDLTEFTNLEKLLIDEGSWMYGSNCLSLFASEMTKLTLGWKPALTNFFVVSEKIAELDLLGCPKLESPSLPRQLKAVKFHPNHIDLTKKTAYEDWKKRHRLVTRGSASCGEIAQNIRELIDISDLDDIVNNYDWNKVGNLEYHQQLFGKKAHYFIMNNDALDNLSNRILARMLIIQSRSVVGKLDDYEKALYEYCEGQQWCALMDTPTNTELLKGKCLGDYTFEQAQEAVNKALAGDKELLSRLQDLPYLHPDYKFDSPSYKFTEPSASDKKKLKKWKNISLNFTEELINQWESKGFSYERTADWINIGFKPTEADYAWWLEKGVGYDPLKYLNETSPEERQDLKEQFYKEKK